MSPWTDVQRRCEEAIRIARLIAASRDATTSAIPGQAWTTEDARQVARTFLYYLGEKESDK